MERWSRGLPFVILAVVLTSCGTGAPPRPDAEEWSYHGKTGPGFWACLKTDFAPCGAGREQSPIVIGEPRPARLPPLDFAYGQPVGLSVINNGHTVQANIVSGSAGIRIGGEPFTLRQFHFHTPSEHLVGTKEYPMELHLVHEDGQKRLAVVGLFLREGDENTELAKFWNRLPQSPENPPVLVASFNLARLLPGERRTWRYPGSLTTPGCGQDVLWNLFAEPIQMSPGQIQAFVDIFSGPEFPDGNRRPPQPLFRRVVETEGGR